MGGRDDRHGPTALLESLQNPDDRMLNDSHQLRVSLGSVGVQVREFIEMVREVIIGLVRQLVCNIVAVLVKCFHNFLITFSSVACPFTLVTLVVPSPLCWLAFAIFLRMQPFGFIARGLLLVTP